MHLVLALGALGIGLALVTLGAELFSSHVRGAARALGVSAFSLALLVAGAEPEELVTSVVGSLRQLPAVAYGDAIGANMVATLVAAGLALLVAPIAVGRAEHREWALVIVAGLVAVGLGWANGFGRLAGLLLVGVYALAVTTLLEGGRSLESALANEPVGGSAHRTERGPAGAPRAATRRRRLELGTFGLGLLALSGGAWLLTSGLHRLDLPGAERLLVGLTVFGGATSIELCALAITTARRGESRVFAGALLGSLLSNTTMTLGAAALARPLRLSATPGVHRAFLAMLVSEAALAGLTWRARRARRAIGALLVVAYAGWLVTLVVGPWSLLRSP